MLQVISSALKILILLLLFLHPSLSILTCSHCSHGDKRLSCPNSTNAQFELYQKTTHHFIIKCYDTLNLDFNLLEGCKFTGVSEVSFHTCPLTNSTFQDLLKKIGIDPNDVKVLMFYNGLSSVTHLHSDHLFGLKNLMYLDILTTNLSSISPKLFQYSPKLEVLHLRGNNLETLPKNIFSNLSALHTLNLSSNNLTLLPDGILNGLNSLEAVYFWKNSLKQIPAELFFETPFLKNVSFQSNQLRSLDEALFSENTLLMHAEFNINQLENLPTNLFTSNANLLNLNFEHNNIQTFPEFLFQATKKLVSINFSHNKLSSLPLNLFKNLTLLESLNLNHNSLSQTSGIVFDSLYKLKTLDLSENNFNFLADNLLINCHSLETLLLSHNNVSQLSLNSFPMSKSTGTSLKVVDLSYNKLNSNNILQYYSFGLNSQLNLEKLDFSYNLFEEFPTAAMLYNFLKLKFLNLKGNKMKRINIRLLFELPNNVEIDLRDNKIDQIKHFQLGESKVIKIRIGGNNFTCDCLMYNFVESVLNDHKLDLSKYQYSQDEVSHSLSSSLHVIDKDSLVCQQPKHLQNRNLTDLNLLKELECILRPQDCSLVCPCSYKKFNNMITVLCSDKELDSIPEIFFNSEYNYSLDLSSNMISSFNFSDNSMIVNLTLFDNIINVENDTNILPPNLNYLDLRKNGLANLPRSFVDDFNNSFIKVVDLSQNPWECNCNIKDLHNFIRAQFSKINISEILCINKDNQTLLKMVEEDICPSLLQPMILTTIGVLAMCLVLIAVIGTVVLYRNEARIKVWLFTHRWCLWFVTEDELDSDKEYDAFISYSHMDEEFVNNTLVPGLENGDPKYRVCLHYRDWIVGEFIQNQILNSVNSSRRTIVVLSNNFIKSVWGQMEFRVAHQQALEDNTNRVIVIVYGEMPPQDSIDDELKHYVSLHTYLEWESPRFWERLRYAMPHPKNLIPSSKIKRDNVKLVNNGHSMKEITQKG